MRKHYASLNYFDAQAGAQRFRFNRTQGQDTGVLTATDTYYDGVCDADVPYEMVLSENEVYSLMEMLEEVLEDWNNGAPSR